MGLDISFMERRHRVESHASTSKKANQTLGFLKRNIRVHNKDPRFLVNSYLSQLVPKSTRTHFW